jgi:hypothetical protein
MWMLVIFNFVLILYVANTMYSGGYEEAGSSSSGAGLSNLNQNCKYFLIKIAK